MKIALVKARVFDKRRNDFMTFYRADSGDHLKDEDAEGATYKKKVRVFGDAEGLKEALLFEVLQDQYEDFDLRLYRLRKDKSKGNEPENLQYMTREINGSFSRTFETVEEAIIYITNRKAV
jgi:hypothetical protein